MMTPNSPGYKRLVVTGGPLGIGAAIVQRMATDGRHVGVNYRRSREAAEALCESVRATGGVAVAIQADVTNPEEGERLAAEADRLLGGIDGLIHNVGDFCWRPLTEMSPREWDVVLRSNLSSTFYMFRAVEPYLRRSARAEFHHDRIEPGRWRSRGHQCRRVFDREDGTADVHAHSGRRGRARRNPRELRCAGPDRQQPSARGAAGLDGHAGPRRPTRARGGDRRRRQFSDRR